MASADLNEDLKEAGGDLSKLEGKEYFAEFFDPTDKLGADVPNPKSHVAYGFATHVVILDDDGRVKEVYAAHDSGKVVNPISIQGQIEGGVLMGLGYALTEDFPLKNGVPQAKYGTLGLMRSTQIPDIHAIYVEKEELLPFAYGAKGIGGDRDHPYRSGGTGRVLRDGSCTQDKTSDGGYILLKETESCEIETTKGIMICGGHDPLFAIVDFKIYCQ